MRRPRDIGARRIEKLVIGTHFKEGDFGLGEVKTFKPVDDGGGEGAGPNAGYFLINGAGNEVVGDDAEEFFGVAQGLFEVLHGAAVDDALFFGERPDGVAAFHAAWRRLRRIRARDFMEPFMRVEAGESGICGKCCR